MFAAEYGTKWPEAAAKIIDDFDVLLTFYDYPAEHFSTVRLRTCVTKGLGTGAAGMAKAFKFIQAAQARWRAVIASYLVALVRAGATGQAPIDSSNDTPIHRI